MSFHPHSLDYHHVKLLLWLRFANVYDFYLLSMCKLVKKEKENENRKPDALQSIERFCTNFSHSFNPFHFSFSANLCINWLYLRRNRMSNLNNDNFFIFFDNDLFLVVTWLPFHSALSLLKWKSFCRTDKSRESERERRKDNKQTQFQGKAQIQEMNSSIRYKSELII